MTLSEIATLCPAPEGMEWRPDGAVSFKCCSKTLDGRIIVINPAYPTFGVHWSVTAEAGGEVFASRAVTLADLPAAYLRALAAVGLATDPKKEALRQEVADLRRTVRECPTCEGSGSMGAVVGVTAPDGEEVIEDVTCAECHGTGVSSWGEALDEAARLKVENAELRRRLTWTEEVPTEVGRYLVEMPMRRACLWTRSDYQPGKPWCSSTSGWCGDDVFPPGTRFLPLANLKET